MCALARVGRALLESRDSQSGMQALTAAQSLISKTDPSFELVAATLRVAAAFSKTDQVRISEGIALGIGVMNKVKLDETPWRLMDPVSEEDAFLVDAKYMSGGPRTGPGVRVIRTALPQAGGFADVLSKLDFNEAILLTRTVNKKPFAIMAQASLCRRVIENSHKEAQKAQNSSDLLGVRQLVGALVSVKSRWL